MTLRNTATLVGITSAFTVSGFNLASSHLFVPLMYKLPASTSARMFDGLYHDGMKAVVPLAAVAIASFSFSAYSSDGGGGGGGTKPPSLFLLGSVVPMLRRRAAFAAAAGAVVAMLAWTRVVMMPVNERLLGVSRGAGARAGAKATPEEEVEGLLRRWRWMNYVRGFGALVAGLIALGATL